MRLATTWLLLAAALVLPAVDASAADPVVHVQAADNSMGFGKTITQSFSTPTARGNLIAVYVVWDNTGSVQVSDDRGDTFQPAHAATAWNGGAWKAQVFYAKSIAGGDTTVTVTLGRAITSFGLLYAHEYSGLDRTSPLDGSAAARSTTTALNSGAVTTANATDLLFGAGASYGSVTSPGAGFTARSTVYGNLTEDRFVSRRGTYRATATQNYPNGVMQLVAFKADTTPPPDTSPPSTPQGLSGSSTSPSEADLSWAPSTDDRGVTAYRISRDGVAVGTTAGTSYHDTGLIGQTSYRYTVSAVDAAGNRSAESAPAIVTTAGAASCSLPAYPKPSCTGVPPGTQLTTIDGDYRASTPGEVIDGLHVTGDLLVAADDVVIRNSQIDGTVGNTFTGPVMHRFSISDSTIGPPPGAPCIEMTALGSANFTATRVHIRGHGDGLGDSGDDILVRDSYVHLCSDDPTDHSDGIQGYLGGRNVRVYHNTIDQRDTVLESQTAPVFFSDGSLDADVQDNLLMGGSETIRVYWFGGTDIVKNNLVVDGSWQFAPVSSSCDHIDWSGNKLVTIDAAYNVTSVVGPLACAG